MLKRIMFQLPLILAGLLATACATTARPTLTEPETTIEVMRDAYREDDAGLFLHTLGKPVLAEYSEHLLRVGWSDIRPKVGDFVGSAKVVEVEDFERGPREFNVPQGFVWPSDDAKLKRVRLEVDGIQEDFLFEREIDDPPEQSKQARGFWIGDRYYVRTEHDSPNTYLIEDSPEAERTHWRLVFPYHPFQKDGELTFKLQQELNREE